MQNVSSMNEFSSLDTNGVHFHLCGTNFYVTSNPVKQHVLHFEVQPYLAVTVSFREIVLIFFFFRHFLRLVTAMQTQQCVM